RNETSRCVKHPRMTAPSAPSDPVPGNAGHRRALTEADAIDVWIARWLRARPIDLCRRYQCDPRRLYEIWEGQRFPAAREKAWQIFQERYPGLVDRVNLGLHRRMPRGRHPDQLELFD